jgi:hypothetical protein
LLRRWLMWAAVAVRTQWKRGGLHAARVFLWAALFGVAALVTWPVALYRLLFSFGLDSVELGLAAVVLAVVAPVLLSWVWGRRWKIGALAGVAIVFFAVQIVLVLFGLGVYFAVEWLVELVGVRKEMRNPVLTRNLG